ncbi:BMP family ABC transporter substrate-binding protein [Azospirillum sp. RWY-5-1]|uniref:BMP family ABC transporter substrate-binding protein n=1 Tax=Azospirillum oleiclasticum TaxID=2735135 RepID=A0ABX2T719_9PROT|nr:BMP family ABC transporter substrate-binding protein [Azospirillum oleiclasticum]NYZ11912.1 BMP family ABC transporter substrate-binding protein [Azospirillum oleiclasticum]NYZ19072.1 BMP family ABC transporter substrate-binding protein [Azospirillum oleiclasticum]
MKRFFAVLSMAVAMAGGTASAQEFAPALVFDMGGKFDKSFNEAAYRGAERFKQETGIAYREFEVTNEAQREQALRNLARRGATVIVGVGFAQAAPIEKVSKEFPKVKFCLIDEALDLPNVQSFTFKEQEGSFLVGMLAAMASKTGKVGFVGGMDIPLIRNFLVGYEQGVKHVNPQGEVIANMTGTTAAAWNDPTRGAELAKSQFDRGSDVVYAAAGATGLGVLQAAADNKKLGIGVDSNQNWLHPGSMLTSMIKGVDVAVHGCMKSAKDGTWQSGHRLLGLKEGAVGWALDEHNRGLVTAEMEKAVNDAAAKIVAGQINVKPYQP